VTKVAIAVLMAVLGPACTEDRSARAGGESKPVCETVPGRGVEGFVLDRAQRIEEPDHVAVRREYRDPDGRLLVYLLGVSGEVGEGAATSERVRLVDGTPARFLGGGGNWIRAWNGEARCPQMAVVGNGFRATEFAELMVQADLLDPSSLPGASEDRPHRVGRRRASSAPEDLGVESDALRDS
jgi:hypothetical protein